MEGYATVKELDVDVLKFTMPPKAREEHFKIMADVFPCREFM